MGQTCGRGGVEGPNIPREGLLKRESGKGKKVYCISPSAKKTVVARVRERTRDPIRSGWILNN